MPRRKTRTRLVFLIVLLAIVGLGVLGTSRWALRQVFPIRYGDIIVQAGRTYDLDPYLIASVIQVESHFDPYARSDPGALGLMQLMPETAEWISNERKRPNVVDRLYEPQVNIEYGCWYLRSLLNEFKGDVVIALAAYNGGRGSVKEWLTSQQWTGERETVDQIPYYETRFYVRRVLATQKWFHQLYPQFPASPQP